MGFKEFIATGKGKIVTIAGGATVAAVGIAAAVLLQGGGFRSIIVQNVAGTVDVVGEKNSGQAYVGENLYSGDDVTVGAASELVMCMDNDKYVYADENTHFSLEASDAKEDSLIKIYLDKGSELNDLQTKLGPNDEYKVDTPTSTMAVRGTKFRVTVYEGQDGKMYTLLEVYEGVVEVELKTTGGVYTGVKQSFTAGQSALIRADDSISEFLVGDENEVVLRLNYDKLPEEAVPRLVKLLEVVDGNVIKGDLELQGETDDEEDALEPTPTPTPEVELVPAPDGDGPDGNGGGDGDAADGADGTGDGAAGTNGPMLNAAPRHVHTAGIWATVTAAHCKTQGHEALLCAVCNSIMDERIVPPTGHSFVNGVCKNCNYGAATAADSSADSSSGSSSDSGSSSGSSDSSSSDPTPTCVHEWGVGEEITSATCVRNGVMQYTCSLCSTTKTEDIAALGHSVESWTAGEGDLDYHRGECQRCKEEIEDAHNWVYREQTNRYCTICGVGQEYSDADSAWHIVG